MWEGEDAYIIGGGPSLRTFDWDLLRGKNTIGCNSAFILGAGVCKIVVFGDLQWWEKIGKEQLPTYGGMVVGCTPTPIKGPEWLLTMYRWERPGLAPPSRLSPDGRWSGGDSLGWCGNSGSLAINLALLLGARRVYLLGFDMKFTQQPNWHTLRYMEGRPAVYDRFLREMRTIPKTLVDFYPGQKIFNVTDDSRLDLFPKIPLREHFKTKEGVS